MPVALPGVDWDDIQARYLAGNETLKAIGDSLGIKESALRTRAAKGKWKFHRQTKSQKILQACNDVVEKVGRNAQEQVQAHLASMRLTGEEVRNKLANSLIDMELPSPRRHDVAESHVRMLRSIDDIIRRAHGLAEPTARVDVTSGGLPLHERAVAALEACRKLVQDGRIEARTVDVEGLALEVQAESGVDGGDSVKDKTK